MKDCNKPEATNNKKHFDSYRKRLQLTRAITRRINQTSFMLYFYLNNFHEFRYEKKISFPARRSNQKTNCVTGNEKIDNINLTDGCSMHRKI